MSSVSRAELEAMERDELVDTIVEMDQAVDNLQTLVHTSIEKRKEATDRLDELADRVEAIEAENERLRERVDGQSTHSKDGKVAQIVQFAQNKAGTSPAVKLDYGEITGATGCSDRYAYDLMDDLPEEYDWFLTPEEMTQYGSIEIDNHDERRLGVDLEGVHSTGCPLNKFNNGSESGGGD